MLEVTVKVWGIMHSYYNDKTRCHLNRILWIEADKTDKNWLPRQRPLRSRKTNFRPLIYSRSSTNPANLVKIGPVGVEIGLTEHTHPHTRLTALCPRLPG